MVTIRLSRAGRRNLPFFRIVAIDSRKTDGRALARLGYYDPILPSDHPRRFVLKADLLQYWLGVGAKMSTRVATLVGKLQSVAGN